MPEIDRLAARLLVVAPSGRIPMLHVAPSFRGPFWVTPGGSGDEGERYEGCARRELHEEVGRDDLPLGPRIAEHDVEFSRKDRLVRQHERTFVILASLETEPR